MVHKFFFIVAGLIFIVFMAPFQLNAQNSVLAWDASSGIVDGYRIYYGTTKGNYSSKIGVGKVTQYPLSQLALADLTKYFFIIKAYNDAGESGDSNEISWMSGDSTPPVPPQQVSAE